MSAGLEFTGERFLPGTAGAIAYEHWHRYAFALGLARGRRVLDAACGEGYGAALLAGVAAHVTGLDISLDAISHAQEAYAGVGNLRFEQGSVTALALPDASFDLVVSFETIEHLPAADQLRMIHEFARVLVPEGILVLSSPNKRLYSDVPGYCNPFHVHELYRDELASLLGVHFRVQRWFDQAPLLASAIWNEAPSSAVEAWIGDGQAVVAANAPEGVYYIVIASRSFAALAVEGPRVSLFVDREQSELHRAEHAASEVLRLDALLQERDEVASQHAERMRFMEELIAYRDALIVQRDGELAHRDHDLQQLREQHEARVQTLQNELRELSDTKERLAEAHAEADRLRQAVQERDEALARRWWVPLLGNRRR